MLRCFRFLSSLGVDGPADVEVEVQSTLFDEHTCLDDFRELSPSVSAESVVVLTDSAIDNCRTHSDNLENMKKPKFRPFFILNLTESQFSQRNDDITFTSHRPKENQ